MRNIVFSCRYIIVSGTLTFVWIQARCLNRRKFSPVAHLNFNYKPFSGHASRLGHYFRHLYLAVKSVANSKVIINYEEKMKYLALLRAQLSNHEQILLFYNWLSGYGGDWENNNHSFLADYKMIHNLWYDTLFDDNFIRTNVDYLSEKPVQNRKGKMYEID
ncbi:putative phage abortive infection protein [Mucilaginibacter sp.]|uniref:putative phage abortive infection protein n=1 Tax=Mucilaginibacter sp. TaxID=1882438 RepID=UPI0028527EDA|nr:putative phage abortive infection protein [Mucilaginibacter sp.]